MKKVLLLTLLFISFLCFSSDSTDSTGSSTSTQQASFHPSCHNKSGNSESFKNFYKRKYSLWIKLRHKTDIANLLRRKGYKNIEGKEGAYQFTLRLNGLPLQRQTIVKKGTEIRLPAICIDKNKKIIQREIASPNVVEKQSTQLKTQLEKKIKIEDPINANSKWGFSAFYMASLGNYNERLSNNTNQIKTDQNAPIALGVMARRKIKASGWALSSSAYWSTFNYQDTNGSSLASNEYGLNLYSEYSIDRISSNSSIYFGVDYEQLITFNTEQVSSNIRSRENQILFATLGFSKMFNFASRVSIFKASLSPIISAQGEGLEYSGFKAIFYANYFVTKKIFVHAMFKHHALSSDQSDLTITRYGAGLGYLF